MRDGRGWSHAALEAFRISAIGLYQSGVAIPVIAKSCKVTSQAVYSWLRCARDYGVKSLEAKKVPGRTPRISAGQFERLHSILKRPATEAGFSTDLWTAPRVGYLLRKKFRVRYHAKHLPRLLARFGLVLKFPERRALEQDPQEVRRWKKESLPEILEYAHKTRALLFYADEALISLIPYVGRSWAFPEAKPIVRVSGKRGKHVGVTAAVNQKGRICFEITREGERFTSKTFIRFIKKLRREHPARKIVLIVDGAPIHKAKLIKSFEAQNTWLRLEILPAYSPELNPAEKPWRFVKTKKLNASAAKTKSEVRQNVKHSLRSLKKDPKRVASFFA